MLHQFLSDPVALGEVFLAGLFFASSILISPPSQNIGFQEREQIGRVKWIYRFVELRETGSFGRLPRLSIL